MTSSRKSAAADAIRAGRMEEMRLTVGPPEVIRWRGIPGVLVEGPFTAAAAELCLSMIWKGAA